jgi:hypothetical protein
LRCVHAHRVHPHFALQPADGERFRRKCRQRRQQQGAIPTPIRTAVLKMNKDRQVTIQCIALGGADEDFMYDLASDNNGQFVKVER